MGGNKHSPTGLWQAKFMLSRSEFNRVSPSALLILYVFFVQHIISAGILHSGPVQFLLTRLTFFFISIPVVVIRWAQISFYLLHFSLVNSIYSHQNLTWYVQSKGFDTVLFFFIYWEASDNFFGGTVKLYFFRYSKTCVNMTSFGL